VSDAASPVPDQREELLALYDDALPMVYGYFVRRCGDRQTAEDLTSETFTAAVAAVRKGPVADLTAAWLVGIARHKLADHWRSDERHQRRLSAVASTLDESQDPWDGQVDRVVASTVLQQLTPQHRAALTLRYLDGLSVPTVADILGRTVSATETLLIRAKSAFRLAYPLGGRDG